MAVFITLEGKDRKKFIELIKKVHDTIAILVQRACKKEGTESLSTLRILRFGMTMAFVQNLLKYTLHTDEAVMKDIITEFGIPIFEKSSEEERK